MQLASFRRWQWAVIGLTLGVFVSLWRGWLGAESSLLDRSTLHSTEFEALLTAKAPSGKPFLTDVRYYGYEDGVDWIIARKLVLPARGDSKTETYIPVKIAADRPYLPRTRPAGKVAADFTVLDYLKSVQASNPQLRFSSGWWDRQPMRSVLYGLVGMLLLAGVAPALIDRLMPERAPRSLPRRC